MNDFSEDMYNEDEFAESSTEPSLSPSLETSGEETLPINQDNDSEETTDLTADVLKIKGITDINKIKFQDDSGAVIERPWDSLSKNEQLKVLTLSNSIEDELDNEEIDLLNNIRKSGLSVKQYMASLIPEPKETPKTYKVDSLTDELMYALDFLTKVGSDNVTDEELNEVVETAKKNEPLFKKTVEGLRKEYIRMQQDEEAQLANEQQRQQQEAYNLFATSIIDLIRDLHSFAGRELELSNDDSEALASYILDLDESGTSAFGRALQDPTLFTEAAFWMLNKNEILEELTKLILDSFKRGYETAKRDATKAPVVFTPKKTEKENKYFDEY